MGAVQGEISDVDHQGRSALADATDDCVPVGRGLRRLRRQMRVRDHRHLRHGLNKDCGTTASESLAAVSQPIGNVGFAPVLAVSSRWPAGGGTVNSRRDAHLVDISYGGT